MKSFSDALKTVIVYGEGSVQGMEAAQDEMTETKEKYAAISEEANQSEELSGAIMSWGMMALETGQFGTALFSAFMAGLIVGCEMEKSEWVPSLGD